VDWHERAEKPLKSMREMVDLSRERFADREFGQFFSRMVQKDLDRVEGLLKEVFDFLAIMSPIERKGTVNTLLLEMIGRHRPHLEAKGINVLRTLEDSLPETTVSHEPLRYVFHILFRWLVNSILPGGSMEWVTEAIHPQDLGKTGTGESDVDRFIRVSAGFTDVEEDQARRKNDSPSGKGQAWQHDLSLKLAKEVLERISGTILFGIADGQRKNLITMVLPAERRKSFYYRRIEE
jgi:hypothetical protein